MSDTTSSSRPVQPSPVPDEPVGLRAGQGSSSAEAAVPHDDQPTIISNGLPMVTPAVSDSAHRILQGKIQPGDRLGHFELTRYVGGGGMGRVFRGVDTRLGRDVALKILPPDQAADKETLLRFQNEAQSAARLDHENIARVYHVGEDRGLHYIVFEFIEGANVRALVERKGPLPLAEAVSYTLQITEALSHADSRHVVHRDVKPSNVLITPDGQVKLIDMGLARLQHGNESGSDLTASGVTLGTFDYISPEQARDPRNADVRSDIYSLGCTFFYMLAGRPPFPEGTVLQKLLQHQGDQPPDVREFRSELPDEAARVLRKMLAKDPRHRYNDSRPLLDDLTMLAESIGLEPVGRSRRMWPAPQHRLASLLNRHLPWIAPVVALVAVVMVLQFLSGQDDQVPPPWSEPPGPQTPKIEVSVDDPNGSPPPETSAKGSLPPKETNGQPPSVDPPGVAEPNQQPPPELPLEPVGSGLIDHLVAGRDGEGLQFDAIRGGMSVGAGPAFSISLTPDATEDMARLTGASAIGGAATGSDPVEDPPLPQGGRRLVVVDEPTGADGEYSSLGAACSAARDGDVVVLRYSGRREEEPIRLANVSVTIQAGPDHEPVVVFLPDQRDADPMKYPRSMFTTTAGSLALVGVALELDVPEGVPANHWTLFDIQGPQTVRLERCSLTVRNASGPMAVGHQDVAFFRTSPAPGAGALTTDNGVPTTSLVTIDLLDSIARGEAVFLRATDLQPVHLVWENGWLVTAEQLLSASGGPEAPQIGQTLRIDLQHVTAVVAGGLCQMSGTPLASHQLATEFHCTDCILMAAAEAPLIEQVGTEGADDLRQLLAWNGSRVFYQRFAVFWSVLSLAREQLFEPLDFEAWTSWWLEHEQQPSWGEVKWKKLPAEDRPLHTHTTADYVLAESTEAALNPAVGSAPHGRDAGFQADRLPSLPALLAAPPEKTGAGIQPAPLSSRTNNSR